MKLSTARHRKLKALMSKLPLMLSCREFEDFVLDYFEGSLPRGQRILFDLHLAVCSDCRAYLAAYRRAVDMGRTVFPAPDEALPEEVPEDLVQAEVAARAADDTSKTS